MKLLVRAGSLSVPPTSPSVPVIAAFSVTDSLFLMLKEAWACVHDEPVSLAVAVRAVGTKLAGEPLILSFGSVEVVGCTADLLVVTSATDTRGALAPASGVTTRSNGAAPNTIAAALTALIFMTTSSFKDRPNSNPTGGKSTNGEGSVHAPRQLVEKPLTPVIVARQVGDRSASPPLDARMGDIRCGDQATLGMTSAANRSRCSRSLRSSTWRYTVSAPIST